jgi:hypothetical protein
VVLEQLGRLSEAAAAYERALQVSPALQKALDNRDALASRLNELNAQPYAHAALDAPEAEHTPHVSTSSSSSSGSSSSSRGEGRGECDGKEGGGGGGAEGKGGAASSDSLKLRGGTCGGGGRPRNRFLIKRFPRNA